jgi:phosphoglycerol geranylgeranyltransferase
MQYIQEKTAQGAIHMTLLDPEKQPSSLAARKAKMAASAGSDAIMVGGSTGLSQDNLDATVKAIRDAISLPIILFPAGAHTLSPYAHAIYFMSVMNSRNVRMVVGEQRKASRWVKKFGLEPIPMGYIIVEPGMTVGEVGEADPVPRDQPELALEYALTAQYFGMDLVYLEAGSGAPDPVPAKMIQRVKEDLEIPLVVGGGIRTSAAARRVTEAGADIVVTGTVVEEAGSNTALRLIVDAVKGRA